MARAHLAASTRTRSSRLLEWLHIPEPDGQKLVLVLAAALALVLCWLTWQVRREIEPAARAIRCFAAYARLCAKLAAVGHCARRPHEGAEDYAAARRAAPPGSRSRGRGAVPAATRVCAMRAARPRSITVAVNSTPRCEPSGQPPR